jgi:hypothetical protein
LCHVSTKKKSIAKVIAEFRAALPQAPVYVYDNNSTGNTVAVAAWAGAEGRRESYQGKGIWCAACSPT